MMFQCYQVWHQLVPRFGLQPQLHLHAVEQHEGLGRGHPDHHVVPDNNKLFSTTILSCLALNHPNCNYNYKIFVILCWYYMVNWVLLCNCSVLKKAWSPGYGLIHIWRLYSNSTIDNHNVAQRSRQDPGQKVGDEWLIGKSGVSERAAHI